MGKTSFSGPVYGARSLLWSVHTDNPGNSTTANTICGILVPPGEDWIVSDFSVWRGSTHSTAFVATLLDDSTSLGTIAITSSAAGVGGSTRIAPTLGEYSGVLVASGSSLTITVHNGGSSVTSSQVHAWVYGFPRWLQESTLGQGPGS